MRRFKVVSAYDFKEYIGGKMKTEDKLEMMEDRIRTLERALYKLEKNFAEHKHTLIKGEAYVKTTGIDLW
jgi:hypothetical protein